MSQDQPVSNTVGSLLEQVKSLPDSIEALSSSVQHVTDLGQVAAQPILHDVASATSDVASATAKEGIDLLSEVLGGPPADPATDNHVAALPATILGAATDNISAAGHAEDSPLPALPSFDAAHLESLQVGGAPTASHDDVHALETPPLQLGFLGQSYIDVADHHHDNGSHTLSSPVHGFI